VCAVLQNHGYTTEGLNSPPQALEVMKTRASDFDLFITDIVMPGMSGPQLVEYLKREGVIVRVLFISGYAPETIFPAHLDPDHFLVKPFAMQEILQKVRSVLDAGAVKG